MDRVIELTDEKGNPLPITAGLAPLLTALSRATGYTVLGDYYVGQQIRFDPEALGRRPTWQILSILALQYSLVWSREGTRLLFRHEEWPLLENEEVPERVLDRWYSDQAPKPRVPAHEYLASLGVLSEAQLRTVFRHFPEVRLMPPYRWEQFWGSFDASAIRELLDGGTLRPTDRIVAAHRQYLTNGPDTPPRGPTPPIRIQLSESGGVIRGSVQTGSETVNYEAKLPLMLPPLPSVHLRKIAVQPNR